jgi:spermidine synthase
MQTETQLYFKHGNLVAQSGDARVYEMDDQLFLEIAPGHDLWALESEYDVYMDQLRNNKPFGECLEIGLGLGVASRCIMTFPEVNHLTTVEVRKDVIETHEALIYYMDSKLDKWLPYDMEKHTIVHKEGLKYLATTKNSYDFIFMDFYKLIDEDTLPVIKDMVAMAKTKLNSKGKVVGWLDPHTPAEFYEEFENIFK